VDELAEREEADLGRVGNVVAGDLAKQLLSQERHLGSNVWEPPVGGDEQDLVTVSPDDAKDADVDPIFEVLVAEVLWDGAVLADCADRVVLPRRGDQPALRGDRGDAAKHRLAVVLELDHDEQAVHR
jgi:hypothetical protein